MQKELITKPEDQVCILFKNQTEIWVSSEKEQSLKEASKNSKNQQIIINGKLRSLNEISGIYTAKEMEDIYKTKKGLVKCPKCGIWNDRFEKCKCEVDAESQSDGDWDFPALTKVVEENKSGLGKIAKRYELKTIKGFKPYTEFEIGEDTLQKIKSSNIYEKIKIGDKKYPRISLDLSSIRVKGKKEPFKTPPINKPFIWRDMATGKMEGMSDKMTLEEKQSSLKKGAEYLIKVKGIKSETLERLGIKEKKDE